MPFQIDREWKSYEILLGSDPVSAFRRKGGTLDDDYNFLKEHLPAVVAEAGILVRHEHAPRVTNEIISEDGTKGYEYRLPEADLWYLPKCSFEKSLSLLETFGFPTAEACREVVRVRNLVKELLSEFNAKRRIALVNISPETVLVELIEKSFPFSTEEMTRILVLNEKEFRVKHGKRFWLSLRAQYRRRGFFVLGDT